MMHVGVVVVLAGLLSGCRSASAQADALALGDYRAWREQREESLRRPDGYLALAGLYWLDEGICSFGSDPANGIVFPQGRGPLKGGTLRVKGGQVTLNAAPDADITVTGEARVDKETLSTLHMVPDTQEGGPTKVHLGAMSFWVIERGGRLGMRLSDPQSPILQQYTSTPTFPYAPEWCLPARLEHYDSPITVQVPTIMGTSFPAEISSELFFTVNGRSYTLVPTEQDETQYFIVFGDQTNGQETYGGGRFLSVPIPSSGDETVIDFNRAYNPPCAYNPYTTCPRPLPQNKLPLRIEAGERRYH